METKRETTVEAWHWIREDHTLRDGQLVRVGETYRLPDGVAPVLCARGYHASRSALDALSYAPGPVLCRVHLSGVIIEEPTDDKLVASERTVLWMADCTELLHDFACAVAEQALDRVEARGETVDARSRAAIAAKRGWLTGSVTTQELAVARDAAGAAAGAAWNAARAAWDAAASAAAVAAARDAAWDAWDAAVAAAWDARAAWAAWAEMTRDFEARAVARMA